MQDSQDVTGLLRAARDGDEEAASRLWPLVYEEVRRLAHAQLRDERAGHTLHTTGLVHEAYLKLADAPPAEWRSRAQFFAICARAMRQILVDHARRRRAAKRGGHREHTTLTSDHLPVELRLDELIALDDALDRLGTLEERLRTVVEMRFFAGMTEKEVGEVLALSTRTVQRDWAKARAWLYAELYPEGAEQDDA